MTRVAVTGASGFIGKNVVTHLVERSFDVTQIPHSLDDVGLKAALNGADVVFHLAGVNRPADDSEFATGNHGMTERLITALTATGHRVPIVYASSIQAERDNPYGRSKLAAERAVEMYAVTTGARVHVFRLPNVFGKWCRPNYNSVVATFCHNISRGLPISVSDPNAVLRLVYVDDLIERFLAIASDPQTDEPAVVEPVYEVTLAQLAAQIEGFRDSRITLVTGAVGSGFLRALHATYVSYLDPNHFDYGLTAHTDSRGIFVEVLRTPDSGQFSYFTAHPGVTRGGHYHHSKTEKFLVVQGKARFGFRNIVTNETFEIATSSDEPRVVETVPGWSHDVTNIGENTMVVMLWANEIFDRAKPDTIAAKVL